MKIDPLILLTKLRGTDTLCACGLALVPVNDPNGKRIGVTHKSNEDEDHHIAFWNGTCIEVTPLTHD